MGVYAGAEPATLWDSLDRVLHQRPDDIALVHATGRLTYRELCSDAEALARGLLSHGACRATPSAFRCPTGPRQS